ncbi:formate/nitrite transporter family protein [Nitrosomonas halophila]|jgi:formate transporter|uniref:Formate transporter n=1 Tax=Nitrosomonas halophila TaxID=44576 RepID=A0A1H3F539_9PROT|nr:formate/nitrite transporter family protein [Nitrosomonas halophila]SDX85294.1 formate transporter [Nitrosomonas halophila]
MKESEQPTISSNEQVIQSSIVAESLSGGGGHAGENVTTASSSASVAAGSMGAAPAKGGDASALDQVLPPQMGRDLVEDAVKKSKFNVSQILVRGFLCTPFLAYATALTALLVSQGWTTAAAGLIFPVGYIMLAMLGLEMATGSFSVMPMAMFAGRIKLPSVVRNWSWTFVANLVGGIFFAWLLWFSLTKGGSTEPSGVLTTLAKLAEKKASYSEFGMNGWLAAVGMGVLCNWLVSLGPVFAKASRSVPGKVMLIWLPIATFFALGFEHAVVNMFVFPIGILSGADVTISQWWWWNQIPVTIGNILGAVIFNSMLWYRTHSA